MYLKETGWKWKRSSWYLSYRISVLRSVRITVKENLLNRLLNPLSPNSDQQQFSPNNIHTLSRDKVMRINKMIIIEKIPWSFIKFSQLILKGDVWRSVWRICMSILGLKGLKAIGSCFHLTSYIIHHMFSTKMFFSRPMQSILRWPTSMFQCLVEQTIIIMPMLNSFWILLRESLYRWAVVSKN